MATTKPKNQSWIKLGQQVLEANINPTTRRLMQNLVESLKLGNPLTENQSKTYIHNINLHLGKSLDTAQAVVMNRTTRYRWQKKPAVLFDNLMAEAGSVDAVSAMLMHLVDVQNSNPDLYPVLRAALSKTWQEVISLGSDDWNELLDRVLPSQTVGASDALQGAVQGLEVAEAIAQPLSIHRVPVDGKLKFSFWQNSGNVDLAKDGSTKLRVQFDSNRLAVEQKVQRIWPMVASMFDTATLDGGTLDFGLVYEGNDPRGRKGNFPDALVIREQGSPEYLWLTSAGAKAITLNANYKPTNDNAPLEKGVCDAA